MVSAFFIYIFFLGGVFFRGFNHCTKQKPKAADPMGPTTCRERYVHVHPWCLHFFGWVFRGFDNFTPKAQKTQTAAQTQVQPLWMPGLFEPAASTPSLLGWSGLPPHYSTKQLFSFSFWTMSSMLQSIVCSMSTTKQLRTWRKGSLVSGSRGQRRRKRKLFLGMKSFGWTLRRMSTPAMPEPRAPGPGAIRKTEWTPLIRRHLANRRCGEVWPSEGGRGAARPSCPLQKRWEARMAGGHGKTWPMSTSCTTRTQWVRRSCGADHWQSLEVS